MKVLVVGAGAYVTGRGTGGPGTVLPALAEASRALPLDEVTICATRDDGEVEVAAAAARVNRALGTSLQVRYRRAAALLAGPELAEFDAAIVAVPDHLHAEVGRSGARRRTPLPDGQAADRRSWPKAAELARWPPSVGCTP